ncbi:adenosylcobinamide-GDP ribazoletransferase [Peribacillus glennii]|uniref:Adenosylcobinamide-GDP ribazoletransferase n=1 Tax=Peribacillus glennii TaxID=2303991 RepID=A0A372L9W5_9BACI|nr:adenosylcobinamide-GDP ribazoletransferase [Peribacillus glennii]RFU62398.1 adenosylcobinamide-GDP ribazoletransferase [Peribacillus glennii]
MKIWTGFLINLQFFTIVPIKKQLPMEKAYIKKAIQTIPILGFLQGALYTTTLYIMVEWTSLSPLAGAFFLWLLTIMITGGLHLDGWIDASDAYFSYRDIHKRLEIMQDPRTGAFGVISVIVLLSCRMFFLYEIVENITPWSYSLVAFVPFLGKTAMGFLLMQVRLAKNEGLAAFFQAAAGKDSTFIYYVYLVLGALAFVFLKHFYLYAVLVIMVIVSVLFLKRKMVKWFGGITGDVAGASVEGVELMLWMTVWLLHYFVTV